MFSLFLVFCLIFSKEIKKNGEKGYFLIAHMANSIKSVEWAYMKGSNGLEVDLNFEKKNSTFLPSVFMHGELVCDCTCFIKDDSEHICSILTQEGGCNAQTEATKMLHFASSLEKLSMIIIDSKLSKKEHSQNLNQMGKEVFKLLVTDLFEKNYNGSVVISIPSVGFAEYSSSAQIEFKKTKYSNRVFFTIDGENNHWQKVYQTLRNLNIKNRIYSTGITSCLPGNYEESIFQAYRNDKSGFIRIPTVWTIDKESSMEEYLQSGAQGIITNKPGILQKIFDKKALKKAYPFEIINPATSDQILDEEICDCDYHAGGNGGCKLSKLPEPFTACKCKYKVLEWTCSGRPVLCSSPENIKCQKPDFDYETCILGGGDCLGY